MTTTPATARELWDATLRAPTYPDALDVLLDGFDRLLVAGAFGVANDLLGVVDVETTPMTLLVGVLMVAGWAPDKLPGREAFAAKCVARFRRDIPDPQELHDTCIGLVPEPLQPPNPYRVA